VWGDYWVIDLAPDYSYAVVGEPKREYLWILSRSPRMSEALYSEILGRAARFYDVSRVVRTAQPESPRPAP
jgi:apolipoprotein D and lipocalin family protein